MSWSSTIDKKWSSFRKTKIYHSTIKMINSNFVAKTIAVLVIWAIALIPVWIYLILRALIDPIGFWQELATFLVCAISMGWIQAITAFIGFIVSGSIIFDEL
jgi:hypothetical protein